MITLTEVTEFVTLLAILLGGGMIGAGIMKRIKFPTIIGFVIIGMLAGPYGLGIVEDVELINRGLNPVNLASNVERFYGKSGKINYSVFALLLNLATILPHRFIKFILKKKVYKTKRKVPSSMLIFFKILAKFKANQTYLYVAPVKDMFHFGTKKLLNSLSRSLRKTSSGVSSVGNSAGGKFRPGTF